MNKLSSTLPDQANRDIIKTELDRNLLVEAAAGTGKTTSMVGRMVALIAKGKCDVSHIAAVTFTRKAAAELRTRFAIELRTASKIADGEKRERLLDAVDRIEQCFIGTIHSFCGRLIRERPIEAGVDIAFEEVDEVGDMLLRERAWEQYVTALYRSRDGSPILEQLLDVGLEISSLRGVFVEKFANFPDIDEWSDEVDEQPDFECVASALRILAGRIRSMKILFRRDKGNDKLMSFYEILEMKVNRTNLDSIPDLMALLESCDKEIKIVQKMWYDKSVAIEEKESWDNFRELYVTPTVNWWRTKRYKVTMNVMRDAVTVYDDLRADVGVLNFQDLLMCASNLLRDNPNVRDYFRKRYTHLLVDEFQDTDPIQAEIILFLTSSNSEQKDWKKCVPIPGSLFVVGDPKQSIYRFRRADIITYNNVKQIIESTGGDTITLSTNFRSSPKITNWVNGYFSRQFPNTATAESPVYVPFTSAREIGESNVFEGVFRLDIPKKLFDIKIKPQEYEPREIAHFIKFAIESGMKIPRTKKEINAGASAEVTPEDFMIIAKNKKCLSLYAAELERLGVHCTVTGGNALSDSAELALLYQLLFAIIRPNDPVALVAVLRGALFGFSDKLLYDYKLADGSFSYTTNLFEVTDEGVRNQFEGAYKKLNRYRNWLDSMPPTVAIERIAVNIGLFELAAFGGKADARTGAVVKAIELLRMKQVDSWSVADTVDYLGQIVSGEVQFDGLSIDAAEATGVRIMNLHKAKGLEAPIVFLADATGNKKHSPDCHFNRKGDISKGYMTIQEKRANYGRNLLAQPARWDEICEIEERFAGAENNRLLYVAATRAGSALIVSQREIYKNQNYWTSFDDAIDETLPQVPSTFNVEVHEAEATQINLAEYDTILSKTAKLWTDAEKASYRTAPAKDVALAGMEYATIAGGEGVEWGNVIHKVLELAMSSLPFDIEIAATEALEKYHLEAKRVDEVINTVEGVITSTLWARANDTKKYFVEVPFQVRDDKYAVEGIPTLVRGFIDLIFLEDSGWVIVDYKTETLTNENRQPLIDYYSEQVRCYADYWQRMTGEPVAESGLYFTGSQEYIVI